MSQRGKRQPNKTDDGPVATKRRKCRPTAAEEEEAAAAALAAASGSGSWTPRPLNDLKISSIYNRSATEAPAELFRKDLISAMKLPDSEPLALDEYWVITDQWKQEWERGVQVPVNPDSLPEPTVTVNHCATRERGHQFKLPKSKYVRITKDEFFTTDEHYLSNTPAKAEKACAYDLDDTDAAWLKVLNGERASMGLTPVNEDQLERVIEQLEIRCWEKVQTIVKTEEGLGIEFDENVICDVCRSPDSEEGNEMVFCDCCNICVHQACYGITTIPSGSWLCRTCALGQRPECVLCPNKGGAMKCTRSGQKWAHVSCALWIPEVSIGCVERMEPITKISSIPQSRWALICVLCRERVGACIQCSVKTCKTAYHVTCAFKHGLEMKAIIEDENADDGVKLRSYCQKHSVKKEKCGSQSEDEESRRRKRKDMTSEEKNQARAAKLQEIEAEFDKHVSIKDVTQTMEVDLEGVHHIYNYWKLKRKAGFNRPLLPPRSEDVDILSRQQEQADIEKMKNFVQLRQDLERVRNLCYMVSRREKLSRSFFRMREQTFHKQVAVLSDPHCVLKSKEVAAVIQANHGPSIYDRLYSQPSAEEAASQFDLVLARIAGIASPTLVEEKPKVDLNGLVKRPEKSSTDNPYKRMYYNGSGRRRSSLYGSMSSASETDSTRRQTTSSQDEGNAGNSASATKIVTKKRNKKSVVSRTRTDASTSEDDEKPPANKSASWQAPRNRTLRQMEREMNSATDDSDELLPMKPAKSEPHKITAIYSDSESDPSKGTVSEEDKVPSDSQQHVLRTKAAMKEFSAGLQPKVDRPTQKSNKVSRSVKGVSDKSITRDDSMDDDSTKDKENVKTTKKLEYDPSELIVPQRQAAKKASESIRCSQGKSKEQILFEQEALKTSPINEEQKVKQKAKHKSKDGKSGDIYDFEKEVVEADAPEILAYVPQRQAAKKAAQHIKSGMTKPIPGAVEVETAEGGKGKRDLPDLTKSKKELDISKGSKKDVDSDKLKRSKSPEVKGKTPPKSREILSSSSSSSSSGDSSSSSDTESDDKTKTFKKEKVEKKEIPSPPKEPEKKPKRIAGKSNEDWPFLDKGDQSSRSSSSSRGSDSSDDSDMFTRKKGSISPYKSITTKSKEGSPSKHVGKKFSKAPDKKLKTSDGRPEPEFQPPFLERDEPSRTKESVGRSRKAGASTSDRLGNADGRPRDLLVSPSRDSSASSGDRPRPPRAKEQLPDPHGRKHRKEQPKSEGGKRKSSEVHSGDASLRKETSKSSQPLPSKKTDKKVTSSDIKSERKGEKKADRDAGAIRSEKEIANRKGDRTSLSKKSSNKTSTVYRSLDKRESKIEKLVNRKNMERDSISPVKVSPKEESTLKHKQPLPKDSHKKSTPSHEISSKRAFRERDLFGVEDLDKPSKISDRDAPSKATKHNAIITTNTTKPSPKHSKEPIHRKGDVASVRKREDKTSSPKKDHRVSSDEKRLSLDLNEVSHKREKDARRESTESLASVSSDVDDDKSKKKAKPMPRCKKQALGILSDSQEKTEIKIDEVVDEKDQMPNVILPNEPIVPPQEVITMVEEMIPNTKQSNELVVLEPQSKPEVRVTGTFRPIPQLEKPDPVEDLQVPDVEPQKITSRTSSLYQQRSIFSPQQPKDPAVAELFDFENDILAVDETVNDDGFSMARDTEELMRPLTFSFSSEFLFKEESKEDSERETLNLVEKLRLEYAKKSTTGPGQGDTSSVGVEDEDTSVIMEEKPPELPEVEVVEPPKSIELKEPSPCEASIGGPRSIESCAAENKVLPASTPIPSSQLEPQDIPLKAPPYTGYEYNSCNVPVSIPGREKLDRSNSDERWVPPSGMEFVQQRIHHYEPHPPDTPAPSPYTDLQARAKWADSEVLPVRRSSSSSASSSSSSSHREDLELQKRDELLYSSVAELYQGVHQGITSFPPCALDVHAYHPYSDASQFVGPVVLFPPSCAQMPFPSPGAAMFPPPFGPPFTTAQLLPPVPKPPEEPHMPPPCGAAFTSSSHNMALTAAMVSPLPQVPTPSPVLHPEPITINPEPLHILNQQPLSMEPEPMSSEPEATLPNDIVVNHDVVKESPAPKPAAHPPGKKSPTKPTRTSARVTSQLSKSPGKSPRQQEQIPAKSPARVRDTGNKRGKGSNNRGGHGQNRGGSRRGRGRGRGNMHYQDMDYNTIHSKLAGTVYDLEFDDDSPSEGVESMRAMRERRRSSDHHERKIGLDYTSQDLSQSPKFANSPHQNSKLRYGMEARDLRPPTPMSGHRTPADEELMPPPSPLATNERIEHFPDVVRPLLPGPVDMRTYSSTGYEPSPANNPAAYHNHLLGQFATAAAEQHVTDFVEDLEKELHTALAASKSSEAIRAEEIKLADVTAANDDSVSQIKVSLSDSRNQLKVKIKGPFLDANYSASSVTQQQVMMPIPPDVVAAASVVPVAATNAFNVGASTGTSNLRRMRKKELLQQYYMIDPAGEPMLGGVAPPTAAPPVSRTVITIPKAVASMTTIPTREDYKAVVDANMEKKRRKEKATLSSSLSGARELRHLDLTLGLEESDVQERRRSVGSTGSNGSVQFDVSSHPVKRRGRPAKPTLKIKIGNSVISEESTEEKRLRIRPPKKRLSSVPMPSMEEMKRESMKFREMIMADFKQEAKKRSKVGVKRKKKHNHDHDREEDQRHEVRIVASESEQASGTKLIIRFNKCASGEPPEDPGGGRTSLPSSDPQEESLPPDKDKLLTVPVSVSEKKGPSPLLKVRTSKMTPIRLKLSRCHEGYVMKKPLLDPLAPVSEPNVSVNDAEQSLNNSSAGSSVPVNQGCEVR